MPLQQPRQTRYSLRYGYFVTMGGFVVDVSHLHNTLSRLTISPKGIAFLAKHGHFVKISDEAIKDKSKADWLAKSLVCIQVGWMLVQTVSRRIVGYPITLVEIHTLVHVACAIGMYGLWFQKPLDVRDPQWVDASEWEELLALMLVRNYSFGARVTHRDGGNPVSINSAQNRFANGSESAYLHMFPLSEKYQAEANTARRIQASTSPDSAIRVSDLHWSSPAPPHWASIPIPEIVTHQEAQGYDYSLGPSLYGPAVCSLVSGQALACGVGPALSVRNVWGSQDDHQYSGTLQLSLTSRDIRRWTLAARAARSIGEELYRDSPKGSVNYLTFYQHSIFLDRKGLQAGFYAYFVAWASGGLIAALVICMFYGAAHATAWGFIFPTYVEKLLWRIACIDTIAGVVSILAVFSVVVFYHEHGQQILLKSFFAKENGVMPILYRIVVLVGLFNFPFCLLARFYVIVESFISLRHVRLGVYQTVEWTDYIPHI